MKKAILSPLSSAFVIPGLGQVLNQQLKKAACFLCAVFVLFVAAVISLYHVFKPVLSNAKSTGLSSQMITQRLGAQDLSILWMILGAFVIVWLFSVLDAFWAGRKIDRDTEADKE